MLAARPRSGYEIKGLVDTSTRFFWAASYGRIYPELKRLEREGLVAGSDASQGDRRRTVYELTAEGRKLFSEWVADPPDVYELRDEALLKLFFAGITEPARAGEIARERAARSREIAARLTELEDMHDRGEEPGPPASPDLGSLTVLRYGIEMNEWIAEWFERAAGELERGAVPAPPAKATT
jgi:DNA-binding PadR family transcriptional regulator